MNLFGKDDGCHICEYEVDNAILDRQTVLPNKLKRESDNETEILKARCIYNDQIANIQLEKNGFLCSIAEKSDALDFISFHHVLNISSCPNDIIVHYVLEELQYLKPAELIIQLLSYSDAIKWEDKIRNILNKRIKLPTRAFVISQHESYERDFHLNIAPLLDQAAVFYEMLEMNNISSTLMSRQDSNNFDSGILIGNDCFVRRVFSEFLNSRDFTKTQMPAFVILPFGFPNDIAHSVYGCTDITTSICSFLLGRKSFYNMALIKCDHQDLPIWSFSLNCGLLSNVVMRMQDKRKNLSSRKFRNSLLKLIQKNSFSKYSLYIQYKQKPETSSSPFVKSEMKPGSQTGERCHRDCVECDRQERIHPREAIQLDEIEVLDEKAIPETDNYDNCIQLQSFPSECVEWKCISGEFSWVGLYTISCRNSLLAPHGFSKLSHRNDGVAVLMLIHSGNRRDLLKLLHSFSVDNIDVADLDYVDVLYATDVIITARSPETWHFPLSSGEEPSIQSNETGDTMEGLTKAPETFHFSRSSKLQKKFSFLQRRNSRRNSFIRRISKIFAHTITLNAGTISSAQEVVDKPETSQTIGETADVDVWWMFDYDLLSTPSLLTVNTFTNVVQFYTHGIDANLHQIDYNLEWLPRQ